MKIIKTSRNKQLTAKASGLSCNIAIMSCIRAHQIAPQERVMDEMLHYKNTIKTCFCIMLSIHGRDIGRL